jgi:hypothetical protein
MMPRPGTAGYCIERDDGHYYLGTIDGHPGFGHGQRAAVFKTEQAAEDRMHGLEGKEPGSEFKVVPE